MAKPTLAQIIASRLGVKPLSDVEMAAEKELERKQAIIREAQARGGRFVPGLTVPKPPLTKRPDLEPILEAARKAERLAPVKGTEQAESLRPTGPGLRRLRPEPPGEPREPLPRGMSRSALAGPMEDDIADRLAARQAASVLEQRKKADKTKVSFTPRKPAREYTPTGDEDKGIVPHIEPHRPFEGLEKERNTAYEQLLSEIRGLTSEDTADRVGRSIRGQPSEDMSVLDEQAAARKLASRGKSMKAYLAAEKKRDKDNPYDRWAGEDKEEVEERLAEASELLERAKTIGLSEEESDKLDALLSKGRGRSTAGPSKEMLEGYLAMSQHNLVGKGREIAEADEVARFAEAHPELAREHMGEAIRGLSSAGKMKAKSGVGTVSEKMGKLVGSSSVNPDASLDDESSPTTLADYRRGPQAQLVATPPTPPAFIARAGEEPFSDEFADEPSPPPGYASRQEVVYKPTASMMAKVAKQSSEGDSRRALQKRIKAMESKFGITRYGMGRKKPSGQAALGPKMTKQLEEKLEAGGRLLPPKPEKYGAPPDRPKSGEARQYKEAYTPEQLAERLRIALSKGPTAERMKASLAGKKYKKDKPGTD